MTDTILFDGVCNLCHASVQFVIVRDRRKRFRFASLQSATGQRLLAEHNATDSGLSSVLLIRDGRLYRQSTAALEIARSLDGLWPLLYGFIVLPRWLRDPVYDFIGRHRYRWFGRKPACPLPDPALRDRFLD